MEAALGAEDLDWDQAVVDRDWATRQLGLGSEGHGGHGG